jgi:hypothetical protein
MGQPELPDRQNDQCEGGCGDKVGLLAIGYWLLVIGNKVKGYKVKGKDYEQSE